MPPRTTTMFIGFQTEIHFKPRASHKQNYDQGGSPPAELRPGRLSASRITTTKPTYLPQAELRPESWLASWLAGGIATRKPVMHLAGWLAEAQRGPERPREAQRGPEGRSVDRTSL